MKLRNLQICTKLHSTPLLPFMQPKLKAKAVAAAMVDIQFESKLHGNCAHPAHWIKPMPRPPVSLHNAPKPLIAKAAAAFLLLQLPWATNRRVRHDSLWVFPVQYFMRNILFISCKQDDNQENIVRFICCATHRVLLPDKHVNVADDIFLWISYLSGARVCVCLRVSLCYCVSGKFRVEAEKIAYQLKINFRCFPKTNCAVGEKGVYNGGRWKWAWAWAWRGCVWETRPPIACETVSYSCIVPLYVSMCVCVSTYTCVCVSYLCHDSTLITGNWYFVFFIMMQLFFSFISS